MVYRARGGRCDVSRPSWAKYEMREQKHAVGLDDIMNKFVKLPRLLLMVFIVRVVRWLDYWGKVPKLFTEAHQPTTVLISNRGSINAPPSTIT